MLPDRKIYQSDLTPEIREIAHRYAANYVGNFEMMIEAKAYVTKYGCLSEGMYRPVLNTLRTDVLAISLWRQVQAMITYPSHLQGEGSVSPSAGHTNVVPMSRARPPRNDVSARERPNWIRFSNKPFRFKYGTTRNKAVHPVVHLMEDICDVEWSRPRFNDRFRGYDKSKPLTECEIKVKSYCARLHAGMRYWREIPTIGQAWEGYATTSDADTVLKLCRSCANRWLDIHGEDYVP